MSWFAGLPTALRLVTYFRLIFGDPLDLNLWIGVPESIANEVAPIYAPRKPRATGIRRTLLPGAFGPGIPHPQERFRLPPGFILRRK